MDKFFLLAAVLFCCSAKIQSQDLNDSLKTYQFSEIVISATKTLTFTHKVASSISVIDSTEIELKNKNSILDLLKGEYGLNFSQSGGPGKLANVFMRGANPGHTLVMFNGIEVNMPHDPSNVFDFSNLSSGSIGSIEILRGPQSTLYGSDALAGVINIFTKRGYGSPKLSFNAEGGSYNTYSANLGLNGSHSIVNYFISAGRKRTDGFSSASEKYGNTEKDGYSNYSLTSNVGLNISDNIGLDFTYLFNKADADLDRFGGNLGDDPTYKSELEESALKSSIDISLFEGVWDQNASVTFYRNFRKNNYDSTAVFNSASHSKYDGNKLRAEWQNNFIPMKEILASLGVEYEEETANTEFYEFGPFPYTSLLPESKAHTTGIYFQNQLNLEETFYFTAGIRYDNHNLFGDVITYRIAPAFFINETGTKIRGTVGNGFKAPSLFNLFDPSFGNKDLEPEKSFGIDFGIDQFIPKYNSSAGVTLFIMNLKNLFGFDANFRTININEAESKGIEVYFNYNPVKELSFKANYTFNEAVDKGAGSPDNGHFLLRRPKHKAGLNINFYPFNALSGNIEFIYTGVREDKDFSLFPTARIKLPEYTLVNFSVNYMLIPQLQLYGRLENILDKEYEEVFGYGTAAFSAYLGAKLNLGL